MLAAISSPLRFSRSVEAPAGWCSLMIPDDVLDACRSGLPDLRLTDASGRDIPYTFAPATGQVARLELSDVESAPKLETVALLDRGAKPPLVASAELEIREGEFLKPVILEASSDGHEYREVTRGSIFAAASARSTTLRFAPNDRRYWRFRLDDRNGDPVHPVAVRLEAAVLPSSPREIPLSIISVPDDSSPVLSVRLPAANLGLTALRLSIQEPAYERRVLVFERVFFRDEISRRLVGAATIRRSPDSAAVAEVAVCDLTGRNLEIEIENRDSPPLHVSGVTALASPRHLLFFSSGGPLNLLYGSPSAPAARYDLDSALRGGRPKTVADATLGAVRDLGAPPPLPVLARGGPLEVAAWKTRQPIELPDAGGLAYLDLRGPLASQLSSLRIVDEENRPVPHIVEQTSRRIARSVVPRVSQRGHRTVIDITELDPSQPIDAVTLFASAPEYFSRDLTVLEEERDERGVTGQRLLGSARWERRPGEPLRPVRVAISAPRSKSLRVEIENGDNAALTIERAEIQMPFVRIDFAFRSGERLSLLSDNPQAPAPRYDFVMIADRVLSSPAQAAHLGAAQRARASAGLPKWFWAAVAVAAVLVGAALVRTLKSTELPEPRS